MGENTCVAIPQSFIQELISRVDVVEVVGRFVQLKKGGAISWVFAPFTAKNRPASQSAPPNNFFIASAVEKMAMPLAFSWTMRA